MQCLLHLRQHRAYEALAKKHEWRDLSQPEAADVTVGIMGMGVLWAGLRPPQARRDGLQGDRLVAKQTGGRGCRDLRRRRTGRISRQDGFSRRPAAADAGYQGYLQRRLFCQAQPEGAVRSARFHQCRPWRQSGRGHILDCLDSGVSRSASLDVFEQDRSPPESRFWDMPGCVCGRRMFAASSDVRALFVHVEHQIAASSAGCLWSMCG